MLFKGRIWQDGDYYVIEIPALDLSTQGTSHDDALYMLGDAIECLVNEEGFTVRVTKTTQDYFDVEPGEGTVMHAPEDAFDIETSNDSLLVALACKRQLEARGGE